MRQPYYSQPACDKAGSVAARLPTSCAGKQHSPHPLGLARTITPAPNITVEAGLRTSSHLALSWKYPHFGLLKALTVCQYATNHSERAATPGPASSRLYLRHLGGKHKFGCGRKFRSPHIVAARNGGLHVYLGEEPFIQLRSLPGLH